MASLNFLERNLLVRGIREGKTFEEAAKALPISLQKHPDLAKVWKKWAEDEAKKEDISTPKVVKLDPDEFLRLRAENAKLKADLAAVEKDRSEKGAKLAEAEMEISRLKTQHGKR